jgi:hypothetical protein
MRRSLHPSACIATLCCLCGALVFASGLLQETPVGDFPPAPQTLDDLFKRSPVVADVEIGKSSVRVLPTALGNVVFRIYDVKLFQIIKDEVDLRVGGGVQVAQAGGSTKWNGRDVSTRDNMRRLEKGTREILFLAPWVKQKCYVIAFGPNGAFRVAGSTVNIPPGARPMPTFSGRTSLPLHEFTAVLMGLAGKKPSPSPEAPTVGVRLE